MRPNGSRIGGSVVPSGFRRPVKRAAHVPQLHAFRLVRQLAQRASCVASTHWVAHFNGGKIREAVPSCDTNVQCGKDCGIVIYRRFAITPTSSRSLEISSLVL